MIDPTKLDWTSTCGGSGSQCFEAAQIDEGTVALRVSTAPDNLIFGTRKEMADLIKAAKDGTLDHLL